MRHFEKKITKFTLIFIKWSMCYISLFSKSVPLQATEVLEGSGPRAGLDTEVRGKITLPLPGIEHGSPGRAVRSQTLY
jgi:hypothetical protein